VASAGVAVLGAGDVLEADLGLRAVLWMTAASFLSGWVALVLLFAVLRRGRFRWFAPYLWTVAAVTLVSVRLG
ncbi:MAG: hypothetical protein WD336_08585, partial [Trueperaceae bacterium]